MENTRPCQECGQDISARHSTARYCEDCAYDRRKAAMKRGTRRHYDRCSKWLDNVVQAVGKCGLCGDADTAVLQFHHKDPARKAFAIGTARTVARGSLVHEVKKCVLLCANCHVRVHKGLAAIDDVPTLDVEGPA